MLPVVHVVKLDSRILWYTKFLEGINWYLRLFFWTYTLNKDSFWDYHFCLGEATCASGPIEFQDFFIIDISGKNQLVSGHSVSNHLEVPWWPSQISLKLCDCDPCPMKWKSWKFTLLTIYRSQDIAIQRSNLFLKIGLHRNFFVFGTIFIVNNSFK